MRRSEGFLSILSKAVAFLVTAFMLSLSLFIIFGGAGSFFENLGKKEVLFALRMSMLTSTVSSVIVMFLSVLSSYALVRTKMRAKKLISLILELSMGLPYILLGLALLMMFSSPFGKWLRGYGIKVVFSPLGIIMAHIAVNLPYAVRLVRDGFSEVDPRLMFIARTLGAGEWNEFISILLPLSLRGIISASILIWSRAMGEFGATLMLVGITRMKTETLPGNVYLNISTGNNEEAMATAMLILMISFLATLLSRMAEKKVRAERRSDA